MKKRAIISLIVAAALILCGGILIFSGLKSVDFDFAENDAEKTYVVSESFQSISVDTSTCDVTLVKTAKELRVVCPETERQEYIVMVEDGVLRISVMDMRQWYDFIGIHQTNKTITVYLPEAQYESLHMETGSGNIEIPEGFSFHNAKLITNTGDITCSAAVTQSLITSCSTGDTIIRGVNSETLECRSSTGDMVLENLQVSGNISIQRSTGKITATDVTCQNLTTQSDTGKVNFSDVLVAQSLQITATTGDVTLQNCDAAIIIIQTSTGDVSGHFRTPKWFVVDTSTGDVSVPSGREGGECRITTSTGNIRFQ